MPNYKGTRNVGHRSAEDADVAIWSVLYADPLYDLRILRLRPTAPQPFGTPPAEIQLRDMAAFAPSASSRSFFDSFGLAELLDKCCSGGRGIRRVAGCRDHDECDPVEHRQAIARAIVAETLAGALTSGLPSVSGWIRDRPVENIAADLKALPHPVQSMLSWTPEHFRQAGMESMRPGRTPSWPQAQVPRVLWACW